MVRASFLAPYELKAGPIVVEGGDLDVDESKRQRSRTDVIVSDIAFVTARSPRPRQP